jgi:fumarate reductase subunit D
MEEIKLTEEEIKDGAPFAALSYVFFLWILTFIWKKDNRFAHFHAKQGIAVFIGEIVCGVLSLVPLLGKVFYAIGLVIFLFVSLYGIYYSLTGRMIRIPIISSISDKFIV